jgi:hypothetical protein
MANIPPDDDDDDFIDVLESPTPLRTREMRDQATAVRDADALADEILRQRKNAYMRIFQLGIGTPDDVETVMLDLASFCRAFESTFDVNADVSRQLDGRREVFLRIMDFTRLDHDQLMQKYHRR